MNVCACERPLPNGDECMKCGRPLSGPEPRRRRGDDDERKRTFEKALRRGERAAER